MKENCLTSNNRNHNSGELLPGDFITFGSRNEEAIIWEVLSTENDVALIISRDIICNSAYHKFGGDTSWETCTLRHWLNNDFFFACFNEKERLSIENTHLRNVKNQQYNVDCGNDTVDKVFLLSIEEVCKYIPDATKREKGVWWWLRTQGCRTDRAVYIHDFGNIMPVGYYVNNYIGVRPALQLNCNKITNV